MPGFHSALCTSLVLFFALVSPAQALTEQEAMAVLASTWGTAVGWTGTAYCGSPHVECNSDSKVTQINLANLQLTGSIPTAIGALTLLNLLDLTNTGLYGTIPPLESFTNLTFLRLSNNALYGPLPTVYPPTLQRLNLGSNLFNGSVPSSLLELNLTGLNLAWNMLTCPLPANAASRLPSSICDLSNNPMVITGGKLCGEYTTAPFCKFLPTINPNTQFPPDSSPKATFNNTHIRIERQRMISAAYNSSTGELFRDEFMAVDFQGVTEQSPTGAVFYSDLFLPDLSPVAYTDGRLGFTSTHLLQNGVSFTAEVELNSPFAPQAAKVSFSFTGSWPYASSTSQLFLQLQIAIVAQHSVLEGQEHPVLAEDIYKCNAEASQLQSSCGSSVANTYAAAESGSDGTIIVVVDTNTKKAKHIGVFPTEISVDGMTKFFDILVPVPRLIPIGNEHAVRTLVASGAPYPFRAFRADEQLAADAVSIVLGRFYDNVTYDPTLQVTRLFDAQSDSTLPPEVNLGVAVGTSVAAVVVVVIVILVVLKVAKFRMAVLPFRDADQAGSGDVGLRSKPPPGKAPPSPRSWEKANTQDVPLRNTVH